MRRSLFVPAPGLVQEFRDQRFRNMSEWLRTLGRRLRDSLSASRDEPDDEIRRVLQELEKLRSDATTAIRKHPGL
jgi:gas vesicle protein